MALSFSLRDADGKLRKDRKEGENWSGEASRNGGLRVEEQRVDITIGDQVVKKGEVRKEMPVWMAKSTVITEGTADSTDSITASGGGMFPEDEMELPGQSTEKSRNHDDIMSVLLAMEKPKGPVVHKVESSDEEGAGAADGRTPAAAGLQPKVVYDSKSMLTFSFSIKSRLITSFSRR